MRLALLIVALVAAAAAGGDTTRVGASAYGDWRADAPSVTRLIRPADMPPATMHNYGVAPSSVVPRPAGAVLRVPAGFEVEAFAHLDAPRLLRVSPSGDVFVAETAAGRVRVLSALDGAATPARISTFAEGLQQPFGIAFYPADNPRWVYVAQINSVIRFPYRPGDVKARGPAETIVARLSQTTGDHTTRDIVFSPDGRRMFVSVGSNSNVADGMPRKTAAETAAWQSAHPLGAAWGPETDRAQVRVFDPRGGAAGVFATGIRNCVGMAIGGADRDLWCSTNERDLLGDDVPPDYVTRVRQGGFYGWPWYYIGAHEDPRHAGERPDLAGRITVPDVLLQPHSAPLQMTFYDSRAGAAAFPPTYRGDAFVALHGSWNRKLRTGYKIVRVLMKHGTPTGAYQDFLTGFVVDEKSVWGRPVGVAVAHDGALLVSDDAGGMIWRVSYAGSKGGK